MPLNVSFLLSCMYLIKNIFVYSFVNVKNIRITSFNIRFSPSINISIVFNRDFDYYKISYLSLSPFHCSTGAEAREWGATIRVSNVSH